MGGIYYLPPWEVLEGIINHSANDFTIIIPKKNVKHVTEYIDISYVYERQRDRESRNLTICVTRKHALCSVIDVGFVAQFTILVDDE